MFLFGLFTCGADSYGKTKKPQAGGKRVLPAGSILLESTKPSSSMYDAHWKSMDSEVQQNYSLHWRSQGLERTRTARRVVAEGTIDRGLEQKAEYEERRALGRDLLRRRIYLFVQDELETSDYLRSAKSVNDALESLDRQAITVSTSDSANPNDVVKVRYGYQWLRDRAHASVGLGLGNTRLEIERYGLFSLGQSAYDKATLVSVVASIAVDRPTATVSYRLESTTLELGMRHHISRSWDGGVAVSQSVRDSRYAGGRFSVQYQF